MTEASGQNYYTRAEVAQRNGKNVSTVWIIYKNGVYDVTNYIHEMAREPKLRGCLTRPRARRRNGDELQTRLEHDEKNTHPGGDVILEEAGRDATKAFNDVGHSADAKAVLAKRQIGLVIESEQLYDENGKKKKRPVSAPSEEPSGRSCLSICTCGLLG